MDAPGPPPIQRSTHPKRCPATALQKTPPRQKSLLIAESDDPAMTPVNVSASVTRRELLRRMGGGFGALGLASVLAGEARAAAATAAPGPLAPRTGHFPARAKRGIFLFMNGGPSH